MQIPILWHLVTVPGFWAGVVVASSFLARGALQLSNGGRPLDVGDQLIGIFLAVLMGLLLTLAAVPTIFFLAWFGPLSLVMPFWLFPAALLIMIAADGPVVIYHPEEATDGQG